MATTMDFGSGVVCDSRILQTNSSAHVLMIPYPAQPHIIPMLDLAQKLASCGGITVTFVSFQFLIDRLAGGEKSSSDAVRLVGVPCDRPDFNPPAELPQDPIVFRESLSLGHNLEPFLEKILHDREAFGRQGPTCLVSDVLHWWTIDVASRLNVPRYALAVSSAAFTVLLLTCVEDGLEDEDDHARAIHVPGLPPLKLEDLPLSVRKKSPFRNVVLSRWPKSIRQCAGLLMTTSPALESQPLESLRSLMAEDRAVLPVGPLALSLEPESASKSVSMEGLQLADDRRVMDWLDEQPSSSVLYVSFGTTGLFRLGKRHMIALARGLEDCQQRFVWVLRNPNDVKANDEFLPTGFEERVKGRGLLLRGWAPQLQILGHPSTGAFLSSCGWNSVTESLSRGVPIIGWPSFADQPLSCRYMEGALKVAIQLPQQHDYFVEAEEITKTILMVLQSPKGNTMRERAAAIKIDLAEALCLNGSSTLAIYAFANLLRHPPALN